jgi:hypothetical protein
MPRPPADATRAMVQIYIETPHSDTNILAQGNASDIEKRHLAKLSPYLSTRHEENKTAWHPQRSCLHSPKRTPPPNTGSISQLHRQVPHVQVPMSPSSQTHAIARFAENYTYPRSPNLYHDVLPNTNIDFGRRSAESSYHNFSESRRPDTVIHIYNNLQSPFIADDNIERKFPQTNHGQTKQGFSRSPQNQQGHSAFRHRP